MEEKDLLFLTAHSVACKQAENPAHHIQALDLAVCQHSKLIDPALTGPEHADGLGYPGR